METTPVRGCTAEAPTDATSRSITLAIASSMARTYAVAVRTRVNAVSYSTQSAAIGTRWATLDTTADTVYMSTSLIASSLYAAVRACATTSARPGGQSLRPSTLSPRDPGPQSPTLRSSPPRSRCPAPLV